MSIDNEIIESEQEREITISLSDLWKIFVKRFWIIFMAAVFVVAIMFAAINITYVPEYQCKATLYILKQDSEGGASSSSDFSLALNVVKDCDYILKCHYVLDKVIEENNLNVNYGTLYNKVSTNNPSGTRILEVTAKASSPELAKKIVDSVCTIGSEKITQSLGFQQTSINEEGVFNSKPCNKTGLKVYLLAGLVTAFLTYAVFFLIFILDDSISTNEEIEKEFGLFVLGEVPNFNEEEKSRYGYGKYGKKYYGKSGKGAN